MTFTNSDIVALRKRTNAGMMDCKRALTEANGDPEKAYEWLREKGIAAAAKKQDRIAAEGLVVSYIHGGGKIGVLLEVNCETDFASRGEKFQELCKELTLQIAANNPKYITREEVPESEIEHEKEILRQQALNEGKPANIVERMVEGRLEKFYKDYCLLDQDYVKDPDKTIKDLLTEYTLVIGEKLSVRRFTRYEMGEGLEKRNDDFASEVAKQAGIN